MVGRKNKLDENPELLEKFYRLMLLIRKFEEKASQLYGMGKIGGFCHLYIGQEAIAVGACCAMSSYDTVITAYRCRGHMISSGADLKTMMAELLGKSTGSSKGKGGSMHMFFPEGNFFGGHGIVGGQIPLGTGIAFTHKYKNDTGVCLTFLGDGTTNQGQFFESLNMAALWKLPIIYVIENNTYGMGTAKHRACAGELYQRGEPFGINGHKINGDDVLEVYAFFKDALQKVRETSMPLLVEIDTYRFKGHSMSDPGHYRSKEELEHAKSIRDPIKRFKNLLIEKTLLSMEKIEIIDKEVKKMIKAAEDFAESSPMPEVNSLFQHIIPK